MKPKRAIVKNISIPILDYAIATSTLPTELKGAWLAVRTSYLLFTDLYPQESVDFMTQVKINLSEIEKELVESRQFQQSLALTLETLLRTRNERKRKLIAQIFLNGYISITSRETAQIERLYRVTQEISLEAIEHLIFIHTTILPMKRKAVEQKVAAEKKPERQHDDEWWINHYMHMEADSIYIMNWLYNEFNPNSKLVQQRVPNVLNQSRLRDQQFEQEKHQSKHFAELGSELLSLGIMRTVALYDGNGYILTEFGKQLIGFIKTIASE